MELDPTTINLIVSGATIVITRILLPFLPPGIPWLGLFRRVIKEVESVRRERDELVKLHDDSPIDNSKIVARAEEIGLNYAAKTITSHIVKNITGR